MARERILIVDGEPKMISLMRQVFADGEYVMLAASKGEQAVQMVVKEQPALAIVGVVLAGEADRNPVDGFEVVSRVRKFSDVPIILLSSSDESEDVLRGFEVGADDFVVKPFDPRVLLARARVLLRRSRKEAPAWKKAYEGRSEEGDWNPADSHPQEEIICNEMVIHPAARQVMVNDADGNPREIYLTETEFNLLLILARYRNRVVLHDQLLVSVWGNEFRSEVAYLRSYIHILRRKLESDPSRPQMILSRPGIGYMLVTTRKNPHPPAPSPIKGEAGEERLSHGDFTPKGEEGGSTP